MPDKASGWISAFWPAPKGLRALTTTRGALRKGQPIAASGRMPEALADNPEQLRAATVGEAGQLQWLTQVHGNRCIQADFHTCATAPRADAVWTSEANLGLVIQTADCVPVVVARRDGTRIGAAHGGWRGLVGGVLEQLVAAMEDEAPKRRRQPPKTVSSVIGPDRMAHIAASQDPWRNLRPAAETPAAPNDDEDPPRHGLVHDGAQAETPAVPDGDEGHNAIVDFLADDPAFLSDLTAQLMEGGAGTPLMAWIGPAIGPSAYEVGEDVQSAVLAITGRLAASSLLEPSGEPGKWLLNLFSLTEWLLRRAGIEEISCQRICTYSNPNLHSYRRDGAAAGRLATVVWKTAPSRSTPSP